MRLGQLARKLDLETGEIIKFLKKKNIEIENHLNTKLEDETVDLVLKAFEPIEEVVEAVSVEPIEEVNNNLLTENTEEISVELEDSITPPVEKVPAEPIKEVKEETPKKSINTLTVSELIQKEGITDEKPQEIERKVVEFSREDKIPEDIDVAVIRAPKVELQGIKVLGKIELPEKIKKETKTTTTLEEQEVEVTDTISDNTNENTTPPPTFKEGKHPNKKKLKTKKIIIPDSEVKKEDEPLPKSKKAKEIKAEKKAKEKGNKKRVAAQKQEETSERQKVREKRKKQREKQKEAPKKKRKSWLRQLWDAIK